MLLSWFCVSALEALQFLVQAQCVLSAGVLAFKLCLFSEKNLLFSRFALHIREYLGIPASFFLFTFATADSKQDIVWFVGF